MADNYFLKLFISSEVFKAIFFSLEYGPVVKKNK